MVSTNWLALFVAALIPMVMGFIWYHPKAFGNAWMKAAGMTEEKVKGGNMAVIFGVSFVLSLLLSMCMNTLARHEPLVANAVMGIETEEAKNWVATYMTNWSDHFRTFSHGAFHAIFLGGIFLVLPVMGTNALFERKSFKYIAVNVGYWIVTLGLMGGLICAWK